MYKLLTKSLSALLLLLLLAGCRKKAFDEYYGRPDSLEPAIYQQLETRGNFKHLLAAIDKAGYKTTLKGAGYWTFFAPTDSAFQAYFTANNISGIAQLDSNACQRIVTYCLVYNAFNKERIDDYQSSTGWVPNTAFRRRTAYYSGVYNGTDTGGKAIKAIASNRHGFYIDADNNNKYIPYFVDNFMAGRNLTAADYNYFYPGVPYTGFNVANAKVTVRDIPAENGMIHIIDKVITALPSLDQYIGSKPEYSLFKSLFDKYLVQYVLNASVTSRYQKLNNSADQVYTKFFTTFLGFSPNVEHYYKTQDNDGQQNCWTMFAPTNDVLQAYIDTVFLRNYSKVEQMPRQIIYDFVNAHMWATAVWPSKFQTSFSVLNEEARFNPASDIIDKQVLSNGIFYGTKKVQDANVFSSVYGKAYLDPKYSMMTTLLNLELKPQISNIYRNYTIFMISNDMFNAIGYTVDPSVSADVFDQWRYTPPVGSTIPASSGSSTRLRLSRIVNQHVIPLTVVNDLSGEGMLATYGSEVIAYRHDTVFGAGNVEYNVYAKVDSFKYAKNGKLYYPNRILEFSESLAGKHIEALGTPANSPYNWFWQYLKNSTLWNNTTKEIQGVATGTFYTLFVPDTNAIQSAINDGLLPYTEVSGVRKPLFVSTVPANQQLVSQFIQYHFLNKKAVAADGMDSGAFETLLKNNNGEATTVFVNNAPTLMTLTDMVGRSAKVTSARSSFLSNRCVIYLTDNYLKYIY